MGGYRLEKVSSITRTAVQDYYTLHVPNTEQYFANGILHHNSGKTFWLIRAIILRAMLAPESRHAVFRFRQNSLVAAVVEDTFPKVMDLCFPKGFYNTDYWHKTPNLFYQMPNGSEIWFAGLDDKERVEKILGQEFVTEYFNECSQIPWGSVVTARTRLAQKVTVPAAKNGSTSERIMALKCYYDFNPPSKRHWTYQIFIEHRDPITRKALDEFNYTYLLMNPEDNKRNLSPEYLKILDELPPKARKRFLLGLFADDSDGSLWTEELLDQQRVDALDLPNMVRIIVAVDPSGCSGAEDYRSDEVGIVVVGLGTDGHGYLLEDLSGHFGPRDWARITNSAFHRWEADRVVAEKNYGGEMVKSTLEAENSIIPVTLVHASRGKIVRAEPISQLYERSMVHHVGYFPEIEDQMMGFTTSGYQGLKSPDRADAVVWGITELFPAIAKQQGGKIWVPPAVITRPRSASAYNRTKRYAGSRARR